MGRRERRDGRCADDVLTMRNVTVSTHARAVIAGLQRVERASCSVVAVTGSVVHGCVMRFFVQGSDGVRLMPFIRSHQHL
jgi:hypothetical protein